MKRISIFYILLLLFTISVSAQEVNISGNKFMVGGKEIWFNGINTPWHKFVDFGRQDFDPQWWEDEFQRYAENKINLARVWIHCSGEVSPNIDEQGFVTGASDLFWEHMDHLMEVSREKKVYVMPALFSFDITKNTYSTHLQWRAFLSDPAKVQSYIDHVLIPMVQRYNHEPYLLAWEICNEPEWMFNNPEHGPQAFSDVQRFHAMLAAAIHKHSGKPVTTGSAAPKWNSPIFDHWGEYEGNMFSDEALSTSINDSTAYLDFYQYHWYPWQTQWMSSPFQRTTEEYGVDDKPVLVGESSGMDVCDQFICLTISQMYEGAYQNGFDGVCAWKTPQNDGHGTFENIIVATNTFYNNHPHLIYPDVPVDSIAVTGVTISKTTLSLEVNKEFQLTAAVIPSNATDKEVNWTSGNINTATVNSNGLVKGVAEGMTEITVTSRDGGFKATCFVTVTESTSGGATCSSPVLVSLPLRKDGAGEFCYELSGNISYINSWNMEKLEINGKDFTNKWSNSLPEKINGKYYISYKGNFAWSHFEAIGSQTAATSFNGEKSLDIRKSKELSSNSLNVYPNPTDKAFTLAFNEEVKLHSIQIFDQNGKLMTEKSISELIEADFSFGKDLPQGLYLVRVLNEGAPVILKIMKE